MKENRITMLIKIHDAEDVYEKKLKTMLLTLMMLMTMTKMIKND